jgi:hypothetical protein
MAKDRSVSTKAIPPPARKDGEGKEIGNLILLALPQKSASIASCSPILWSTATTSFIRTGQKIAS